MLDRQDIDALLVGALYGELTPADEARLTTHLESHPGDRTALDDLKFARTAVRESRIFELQLDPPHSITALILQEAARRAPRRVVHEEQTEGWFARLARSFVAHPAMAAAASLVLVVGVAGSFYLAKGHDQFAEQTAQAPAGASSRSESSQGGDLGATGAMGDAGPAIPAVAQVAQGSGMAVGLMDGEKQAAPSPVAVTTEPKSEPSKHQGADDLAKRKGYFEVRGHDPMPKDLPPTTEAPKQADSADNDSSDSKVATYRNANGRGGATTGAAAPAQQQSPRSTVAATTPAPSRVMAPQAEAKPPAPPAGSPATTDALVAWAKSEHARVTALVRDGKCQDAATIAVSIKNRAPDYYNTSMATDRGLNKCMQYINDAAEKDSEKSAKSRPAKRADSNESMH